jgi:ribosomal protein S18 acetylase RimI-like enzyme
MVCAHDRGDLEAFLRRNTYLHLYEIGDLDDFFWPYTTWYAACDDSGIREVALLYLGCKPPTLLALTPGASPAMRDLLRSSMHLLPQRIYAHLSDGLVGILKETYGVRSHGRHLKLALTHPAAAEDFDASDVAQLSRSDVDELQALYQESYPGNWFDPHMLETGCYYGIRRQKRLVSVAGIHVISRQYRVAVLGNVTTHPDLRGQGLATRACAALCRVLLPLVDHVGVNVKADNASALACYSRLGFERVASYGEFDLRAG